MDASKVGIMALGSHEERHGAALPLDTDAKLASHVAQEAAKRAGAKFIGVLYSSHELPGIDTGKHQSLEEVLDELRTALLNAKRALEIKAAVLVNGHGGNEPIRERLPALEAELGMRLVFNNTLIDLEGPHAATGELSMGAAVGIVDFSRMVNHADFARHPEVGFVGLREARRRYDWAERQAQEVEKRGVRVDKFLGEKLLECVVIDVINDIREL
ncbi:MAG: 2-amino-5-formylamino-6-ribosylaminopyrimidin-4(3H)-one 5'-monophosphate deformylase [Candidatus Hodarchaeaceae archaeon]|nr:2-amino-5-formylamino-6-ribosylaminopyrimidin-4(3H)-one 5'-monophosphate deformylase [Candidatus Hodarchaeaceae archaeon]